MQKNLVKASIRLFATLFILSLVLFAIFTILPGDPALAILGPNATPEQIADLTTRLGLNQAWYWRYLSSISGLFGGPLAANSWQFNLPVHALIAQRLGVTLSLVLVAFVLLMSLSLPLAVWSIRFPAGKIDRFINLLAQFFMAIPTFFNAMILTLIFGYGLRFFQPGPLTASITTLTYWRYLFFPALALALPRVAQAFLFLRNALVEELKADYIILARSKGLSYWAIILKHALRNALPPFITSVSLVVATLFTGTLVIEQVFSINGIGKLLFGAISHRDFPLVQAILLMLATIIITLNVLADYLNQRLDKRLAVANNILSEEQFDRGRGREVA